jgi:hypothetical protein
MVGAVVNELDSLNTRGEKSSVRAVTLARTVLLKPEHDGYARIAYIQIKNSDRIFHLVLSFSNFLCFFNTSV